MRWVAFSIIAHAAWVFTACQPGLVWAEDSPASTITLLESVGERLLEQGRQELLAARIRTTLADRKDLRSRYIRVRFDGKTVHLAGFVTNTTQSLTAEDIARRIAPDAAVVGFWAFEPDLDERDAYMTRVGEQAADAEIWARVQVALRSPTVRSLLTDADVQAVDVRHGNVRLYLIADTPDGLIDLAPHIRPIPGVTDFSQRTVIGYETNDKE